MATEKLGPTKRLRFSAFHDIVLLREVLANNPFKDFNVWQKITGIVQEHTGKAFSTRSLKEHLQHLMKLWTQQDKVNLRKCGTEDEYAEKEYLLEQVEELKEETAINVSKRKRKLPSEKTSESVASERTAVYLQGEDSTTHSSSPDDLPTPVVSHTSSLSQPDLDQSSLLRGSQFPEVKIERETELQGTALSSLELDPSSRIKGIQLLEDRMERELKFKEAELQLRREELQFQREKFEFEKSEREVNMKIEKERHEQFMLQQNLILQLLSTSGKRKL